jgi:hypothetical protein
MVALISKIFFQKIFPKKFGFDLWYCSKMHVPKCLAREHGQGYLRGTKYMGLGRPTSWLLGAFYTR